jgi:hypothetical protein
MSDSIRCCCTDLSSKIEDFVIARIAKNVNISLTYDVIFDVIPMKLMDDYSLRKLG